MVSKLDYLKTIPARARASYRDLKQETQAAAARTGNRVQSALTASESNNVISNQAETAASLLLQETTSSNGDIWFGDNNNGVAMDQDAMASNLSFLREELTDAYGLNSESRLLNDSKIVEKLVTISRGQDHYQLNLRKEAEKVLNQLLDQASRHAGLSARECPEHLQTILKTYNTEVFEDSSAAIEARHLAVAELIRDIAKDKKEDTPLNQAVQDYVNSMPRQFKGSVSKAFQSIVKDSLNDILSNPKAILENQDLVLSPNVLRAYTQALAETFEASIPKAVRKDELVQSAKALIAAFEEESRAEGQTTRLGVAEARSQFVELLLERQYDAFRSRQELVKLLRTKDEVSTAMETGMPIVLNDEFLTSGQSPGTAIKAEQKNLEAVNKKIKEITKEIKRSEDSLKLSLGAINKGLKSAASPFGEQANGLQALWMDRLVSDGDGDGDASDLDSNNTIIDMLLNPEGQEIEFSRLNETGYAEGLNGFKKILTEHLEELQQKSQQEKTRIEANLSALEQTKTELDTGFNQPLESIAQSAGTLVIPNNTQKLITGFKSFTNNDAVIENLSTKAKAVQTANINIIHSFLMEDSQGTIVLNDKGITDLALDKIDELELIAKLAIISTEYNKIHKQDVNHSQTINWTTLSKSLNDIDSAIPETILEIITEAVPVTENPNIQYSNQDQSEEPRGIFALRRKLDNAESSLELAIARAFDYEQKAYGVEGVNSFASAVQKLETNLSIEQNDTANLLNGNLSDKIETSITIGNRIRDLERKLDRTKILTDETHPLYNQLWEKEMRAPKLTSAFNAMLVDSFQDLGLTEQATNTLLEKVEDFAGNYSIIGEEQGLRGWVEDMLKYLIKYLNDLGITNKN